MMKTKLVLAHALWMNAIVLFAGCATPPSPKPPESTGKTAVVEEPANRDARVPEQQPPPLVPTTEEQIRARYDKMIRENSGQSEYRVSHILVATEPDATAILIDLKNGKKFKELARMRSKDGSAKLGGDLGWSVARIFPSNFAQAVRAMDAPGLYTKPVQTSFGWHVISVEAIRTYQPPTYESFRQGIEALNSR